MFSSYSNWRRYKIIYGTLFWFISFYRRRKVSALNTADFLLSDNYFLETFQSRLGEIFLVFGIQKLTFKNC